MCSVRLHRAASSLCTCMHATAIRFPSRDCSSVHSGDTSCTQNTAATDDARPHTACTQNTATQNTASSQIAATCPSKAKSSHSGDRSTGTPNEPWTLLAAGCPHQQHPGSPQPQTWTCIATQQGGVAKCARKPLLHRSSTRRWLFCRNACVLGRGVCVKKRGLTHAQRAMASRHTHDYGTHTPVMCTYADCCFHRCVLTMGVDSPEMFDLRCSPGT
jgi:hypothetical protein